MNAVPLVGRVRHRPATATTGRSTRIVRRALQVASPLLALWGCTSTTTVFRMTPDAGWEEDASGCAGPLGSFSRTLDDGVIVALAPKPEPHRPTADTSLVWVFTLDRGKTVRLLGRTIIVEQPGGSRTEQPVPDFRNEDRWVTSDALLTGARGNGRRHIARSGQVEGDADYFRSTIPIGPGTITRFEVRFPDLEVNGRRLALGDRAFERKSTRFVQCVQ